MGFEEKVVPAAIKGAVDEEVCQLCLESWVEVKFGLFDKNHLPNFGQGMDDDELIG